MLLKKVFRPLHFHWVDIRPSVGMCWSLEFPGTRESLHFPQGGHGNFPAKYGRKSLKMDSMKAQEVSTLLQCGIFGRWMDGRDEPFEVGWNFHVCNATLVGEFLPRFQLVEFVGITDSRSIPRI